MRPVRVYFLLCLAVGVQCLVQAPPGLSGDKLDEALRSAASDSAASSWEHRLRRDTSNQKWIHQVQDYARTQMVLEPNLLSPFRLDLPIADGEETLPVLVLPVPVGSCHQGINYQQDDKDTNTNFNGYQRYPSNSNNYGASPNQVHNYYHNNIFLTVAGPSQKVQPPYQPPTSTFLEHKDSTVQKFASPSLYAANYVPKYPLGLRDEDYVPPLPTRPPAPITSPQAETTPPPPSRNNQMQGIDVRNQKNASNLNPSQNSPNVDGNNSPPVFYFPPTTTQSPLSRPFFITPLKKSPNDNSDPIINTSQPSLKDHRLNTGDASSSDIEASILSSIFSSKIEPSSESSPAFTSLIASTTNIGTNATPSLDPSDSKALTNGTSPPQPLPLPAVPSTVENDSLDEEDYIPPRFFANDGI